MASKQELEHLISVTHQHGIAISQWVENLLRRKRGLEKLNRQRRLELDRLNSPPMLSMFDSTETAQIPKDAVAVAGYVNGRYATYREVVTNWPHARHLSIDVTGAEPAADCLDVETGDATPEHAPGWYFRKKLREPHSRPCFYANLSTMPALISALNKSGISRASYRLWVADYTYAPHIPFGFDACQWTNKAFGKNLDQSLCFRGFV